MGSILSFITSLLASTFRMATPVFFAGLGELYSERVGLVNIGLDGLMTIGAAVGFVVGYTTGSPYIGLLGGMLAGILLNLIYAFCTVTLGAGQIILGMSLNILAPALATYIYRSYFGVKATLVSGPIIQPVHLPFLSDIPVIGPILFSMSPLTYLAIVCLFLTLFFFNRTRPGLNFIAVGEYPKACETLGINVMWQKYLGCIICGALCGLGGAFLVTCYISSYSNGIVGGRGFIALAAVIFGGWKPVGILLATLLFGFADALQLRLQLLLPTIPYQFFSMLPYLCTFAALALFRRKNQGPKAAGKAYVREMN